METFARNKKTEKKEQKRKNDKKKCEKVRFFFLFAEHFDDEISSRQETF